MRSEGETRVQRPEEQTPDTTPQSQEQPLCFGDPQQVCPKDERGFMQPQVRCLSCIHIKACLPRALRRQGVIADPDPEAPGVSRVSHFLRRWSEQKSAHGRSRRGGVAD